MNLIEIRQIRGNIREICEQPRGKGTPGYGDFIFYEQYLRRYEQVNEK